MCAAVLPTRDFKLNKSTAGGGTKASKATTDRGSASQAGMHIRTTTIKESRPIQKGDLAERSGTGTPLAGQTPVPPEVGSADDETQMDRVKKARLAGLQKAREKRRENLLRQKSGQNNDNAQSDAELDVPPRGDGSGDVPDADQMADSAVDVPDSNSGVNEQPGGGNDGSLYEDNDVDPNLSFDAPLRNSNSRVPRVQSVQRKRKRGVADVLQGSGRQAKKPRTQSTEQGNNSAVSQNSFLHYFIGGLSNQVSNAVHMFIATGVASVLFVSLASAKDYAQSISKDKQQKEVSDWIK